MYDHKCEAIPENVEVWAPRYRAERNEGWRLYVDDGDNPTIIPIRFCPFCGEELAKAAPKPVPIEYDQDTDPDDDPYDRPWED